MGTSGRPENVFYFYRETVNSSIFKRPVKDFSSIKDLQSKGDKKNVFITWGTSRGFFNYRRPVKGLPYLDDR